MANTIPCGKCKFYDIILGSYEKKTKRGWCTKRSKYPFREGPGQVFPAGVERLTDPTQMAQPFIVQGLQIIAACSFAEAADRDPHLEKKERVVQLDGEGKRILS